jgi:hypothetical protein
MLVAAGRQAIQPVVTSFGKEMIEAHFGGLYAALW